MLSIKVILNSQDVSNRTAASPKMIARCIIIVILQLHSPGCKLAAWPILLPQFLQKPEGSSYIALRKIIYLAKFKRFYNYYK